MPSADIQTLVEQFAAQIQLVAKRVALEEVVAQLGGSVAPPRKRGQRRPRGSGRTVTIKAIKKGTRRSAADVESMGTALLDYVKSNPGSRGEQIAAAMKSDVMTIRLPMKALIKAKRIKTKGQRRGMMYFAR